MEPLEQPENWEELLAGYVLGDLSPEEATAFKQYLDQHPELQQETDRLQNTLALLPLSLPPSQPSPDLPARLLEAATQEQSVQSSSPVQQWRWPWGRLTFGAVMIVVATGFGWSYYRLNQQLAATQGELNRYREAIALLRQPNNRLLTLKGMEPDSQSSGSLVIAPQGQAAVLTLQNVSPPPPGKVYRMWAYMGDRKVSCAEFMPNAEGKVFLQLPLDQWAETSTVVVTIEPLREMPEPTGEKVMEGWRSL